MINMLFELYFFSWYKRKKWFLWAMVAAQTAENYGDWWGLTWYLRWMMYTPIPPWTYTKNSDVILRNIPQLIVKTVLISTSLVISCSMASPFEFDGKSMEIETAAWSEFRNEGKVILEQILVSEEINKSKWAGLWELQSWIWVGKLTI